ncbi:MAG: prephenate dehydrogenase/arogenate dehydrogenase family protein [Clostridiales bacterium]|nr:prephenate dehydrogenase/arogenate dehydrogenase family protein [Clostridiales bacterium]
MNIGIVGLGLIGGSLAKAFKFSEKVTVLGTDINKFTTQIAVMSEFIDGDLDGRLGECDFVFIAISAAQTVEYVKTHANEFKKDCIVVDCCGVKTSVCKPCFEIAENFGFHFIGGHPMAGTQYSGLKYSKQDLFVGQNMVLVPKHDEDVLLLKKIKDVLTIAGFASVSVTTAEKHDEIIAFTSQLAHVVSNAYVKSPNAVVHKGFSAGSYKDLTRVAWLNEEMWARLFLDNAKNISFEIKGLIEELKKYDKAITENDFDTLKALLKDGRERKERCDKGV